MAVTIYDLAREAHVSIATVSKALNDSYTISDKTRERIQTLARQMNYQPNARARSFARQRNGTVLFAANLARGVAFEDPHLFEIINGVERRLDEKGYSLLIKHVPPEDAPERICSLMQSEQADGVMLHAGILTRSLASVLIREEMPHLVVGKPSFPCNVCWMDVSHEAAGQLAANYLLDKGYTVFPVHPVRKTVWGLTAYPDLASLPQPVDIIDLFRAPQYCPAHAQEVLALPWKPLCFWMQEGIRSAEARALLEPEQILVVEDLCLMVEHARLLTLQK